MKSYHFKIVATIEARMTSSRLPGKVLLPANGIPMLGHVINRLKRVKSISEIVLATTGNQTDDCLVQFAKQQGISWFRGSEEDVMSRVINAAETANADIVVEITGDCPVTDPIIVEHSINMFLFNSCDYLENGSSYPAGVGCQVFWLDILKRSAKMTDDPLDHEHVTLHIRNHPEIFSHICLIAPPDLWWPELELVLDEKKDYKMLKLLIEHFGDSNPIFTCREAIEVLRNKPNWVAINKDVKRKGAT